MTTLNILIINLLLTNYCYGRITNIESLHIQRSSSPFIKRPDNSITASSLSRFPNLHPNISPSPNIPNLSGISGISGIKSEQVSSFSQSLGSASVDQPNALFQNVPSLPPTNQSPQINPNPIQSSSNLNLPMPDQKQDIARQFPIPQAQSDEPLVGPDDNVESTAHQQSMTDQSQMQVIPETNTSTNQDSSSNSPSQLQSSMKLLQLAPRETSMDVPMKSLTTSAANSADFEEGPLDENLRSINLEVTKAQPITSSLVGSDNLNAEEQSSDNSIPLTQAINEQSGSPNQPINLSQQEVPVPVNDPNAVPQSNTNLSQAIEPAARAIVEPAQAQQPAPIAPAQVPAPAPSIQSVPAPQPIQPLPAPAPEPAPPLLPTVQQQITNPQQAQQQLQPNHAANPNDKIEVAKPNNSPNQQPTTINPVNNSNSSTTSAQPNQPHSNQNQQAPSQSSSPPPPPANSPTNVEPNQTPSPSPSTPESQSLPSPTSTETSQDSQQTSSASSATQSPDPSPSSSSAESTKNSSISYIFKSVKPINTLMDSNSRPNTKCSNSLLVGALLVSIGVLFT